jgi:hypothetical protein
MVLKIIVKKVKKNVHKLDLNIKSTYLCRNKNEKAMKKQEMINAIMLEERKLWNDLQECLEKLGVNDPITDLATARWAAINKLVKSLGL